MRQKAAIIGSLMLLLAFILFMAWDLFFSHPGNKSNPYDYGLNERKLRDTLKPSFSESQKIVPGLLEIHGVATDTDDNIYIAGADGVEIYNRNGTLLKKFNISGTANCITVDKKGNIFLGMEDHIEVRNGSGILLQKWKNPGKESYITSIAIADSFIFVADAGQKVIYRFNPDGNRSKRMGDKDPEKGIPGFIIPSPFFDLAITRDGFLWAVNTGRHQFEKYTFDGNLVETWGQASMHWEGFCGCCNPTHFALLRDGSFITSEKGIERIKVYSPDGKFSAVVATHASFEEGTKGVDLAVDSRDRILVLDPVKRQVRIFINKNPM